MVTSILEFMDIRTYIAKDIIIKCGSYGEDLFIILEGEALVFGINNELVGLMRHGSHFNNSYSESDAYDYKGKRLIHMVAKSHLILGVVDKKNLEKIFEAYPYFA
jgi:CRP-like cAMP-binding protein